MSPVQEGSVVVYVIDDTGSIKYHAKALFDAFDRLTGGVSLSNVRLAAVKHGHSWGSAPLAMEKIKDSLFDFRAPDAIPVNTLRGELSFSRYHEQLYPGIMAAKEMIEVECPKDVDLDVKPWCQRKVIVVLGDGEPGTSPESTDYFPQPYADVLLPTNLLSGLKNAGIQVDTLCIGWWCQFRVGRSELKEGRYWFYSGLRTSTPNLLGSELMEAISSQTGGVYHGVAD